MEVEAEPTGEKSPHDALDEARRAMEEIAAKILLIKKENLPKSELREFSTQMSLLFITLRQLNRTMLVEEDRIKAETESAKAPVDFTTLQLHNLMYEKNHYLKAIKTCRDFRSKYPDIELVPEEEFFKNAPEDIKAKVLSSDKAHDLMLKRFNYELFQRKELCKLHEKLEEHKRSLLETIANRKKFLSSLPSHLKSLKKATLPVQQQLGILHTKKLKQHSAAELLPPPLYILYSQLLAQKEAFGEKIEVEITGSVKDAQNFHQQQAGKENGTSTITEISRVEDDAPEEEEDVQRRRKRPKKNMPKDLGDQGGIMQSHPLKVFAHVFDDEDLQAKPPKLMTLKFEYLIKLNVVCVGIEDTEQGSDENILSNLFPNDTGTELPHQTAKLYAGDFVVFDDKCSRPYMWAQHLCGMDFLPEVPPLQAHGGVPKNEVRSSDVSSGLSLYRHENRVQTVLQRIRSRKKAQMALMEQLNFLLKLKWPLLDDENVPWALHTPLCSLQEWLLVRPLVDSSSSAVASEKAVGSVDHELDRSSITPWEMENAREDGELPMALPASASPNDSRTKSSNGSPDFDSTRSLALISKNITPPKMVRSLSMGRHEDDLELILDTESDMDEKMCIEQETEIAPVIEERWIDYAAREFHMVLCRKSGNEQIKLEAKVQISIEYPLRAPLFNLRFLSDSTENSFESYNELHAMELEVNLNVLNILPMDSENYVLAHQVRCLAMLFDLHVNIGCEQRKSSSVPVNDSLLARVVRGRDRRRMLSWKGLRCK